MASRVDSLQDIFGPNEPQDDGSNKAVSESRIPAAGGSSTAENVDDFDDIFGGTSASSTPHEGQESAGTKGGETVPATLEAEDGDAVSATAAALDNDEFDDIFGDARQTDANTEQDQAADGREGNERDDAGTESDALAPPDTSAVADGSDDVDADAGAGANAGGVAGRQDKEFLDFLYEDESSEGGTKKKRTSVSGADPAAPVSVGDYNDSLSSGLETAGSGKGQSPSGTNSEGTGSPVRKDVHLPENNNEGAEPTSSLSVPSAQLDSISLRSTPHDGVDMPGAVGSSAKAEVTSGEGPIATATAATSPRPGRFVRKEKIEVLRPLPDNPARALRELLAPPSQDSDDAVDANSGDGEDSRGNDNAAADDVSYVRRLCAATGGFLPHDLRPAAWSLLLGLGRTPKDLGFEKWRDDKRADSSTLATAATVAYKLDLRNDSLALARQLCEGDEGDGEGAGGDPAALAVDIEEVLTFYCSRRSEAYDPILCALVGPLFSMGLEPSTVSAMLYPLVGSATLFLGRGMTRPVRDLAWAHAHRRLHDLCTYHDPELVQHLDRCYPGWEMPLPAASVSHAETSALDLEAAAMVDDLESSLGAPLNRRRSAGKGLSSTPHDENGTSDVGEGGAESLRAEGQGLVEPSFLVAANAGMGNSVPLSSLLPLWDYLLVRHDKHFGFFLLLATLLRRREELLAATGPQVRTILSDTLSPANMAKRLDGEDNIVGENGSKTSALVLWCKEAESLDLTTPESFRHHLALIGEIAEAEHEAAVRERALKKGGGEGEGEGEEELPAVGLAAGGAPATEAATPAEGESAPAKGLGRPSLLRMRSMMKNAGDKLAADIKNLKLARPPSGPLQSLDDLAPPTELSLPQLCLAVSAKEVVTRVSGRSRGLGEGGTEADAKPEAVDGKTDDSAASEEGEGEGKSGLFRERRPLAFFAVDCRPTDQVLAGRFPTAYHLDPSSMDNPEEMAETMMQVFEPLRRHAHVCLVGSGDGHLRARGVGERSAQAGVGSQKAARDEYSYVNTCALFFVKRGFPYVSVLEGGFAAAHELVMDTIDRGGDSLEDTPLSAAIVDHDPAACRLCLAKRSSSSTVPGISSGGGGGMERLLFPLSPPLWARIGAADSLAPTTTETTGEKDKEAGQSKQDASPFFSASVDGKSPEDGGGGTERASSNDSNGSGAEGAGIEAADTIGGNLFKGGGMFRGMKMNLFKGASGGSDAAAQGSIKGNSNGASGTPEASDKSGTGAGEAAETRQSEAAPDLAAKFRMSLTRFTASKEAKNDGESAGNVGPASGGGVGERVTAESAKRESGFGSLFRKAQSLKPADVAAAFAELRDGPKASANTRASESTPEASASRGQVVEVEEIEVEVEDNEDESGGLFIIGDDGSEASENPDSDFEGFDGEHRPPSAGGVRSEADKEIALLEHRLSGQVKGGTMVVDEFLKVPGAKVFDVTKHKVTYHDVDATHDSSETNASDQPEEKPSTVTAEDDPTSADTEEGPEGDGETPAQEQTDPVDIAAVDGSSETPAEAKKVTVRAVTELERVVFLTRERILVLACPDGPRSPGLVKSNHHLTELQKMTFMRRDPTLVTLHYLSMERAAPSEVDETVPGTKRNVYRFDKEDKEAFIRIIRGALQRFQA